MTENKDVFPNIDIFPRLTRVAKTIGNFFCMHQLSNVSDHFQHDTLATPSQPVTNWGQENGEPQS